MIRTPRNILGIQSDAGGPTVLPNVPVIARRLRRYFAPATLFQAPMTPFAARGNRNVAITSSVPGGPRPLDSTTLTLVNGQATWYYNTKFNNPPIVTVTPLTNTGGASVVYLQGPGTNIAVVVVSANGSDARQVHCHATGNPN